MGRLGGGAIERVRGGHGRLGNMGQVGEGKEGGNGASLLQLLEGRLFRQRGCIPFLGLFQQNNESALLLLGERSQGRRLGFRGGV